MPCDQKPGLIGGGINDLSSSSLASVSASRQRCCGPRPSAVPCVVIPLLLAGLGISIFILAVVHNPLFFCVLLALSSLVLGFLLWNCLASRSNRALLLFLDRFPASNLRTAADAQLVKITGFASCGDVSLVSSYEKVGRCVYTSTLLYTCGGWRSMLANLHSWCITWDLVHLERMAADFYITDERSGVRALVKAGQNSKLIPLMNESVLVSTRSNNRVLSLTLKKWLDDRHLSVDSHLLRLDEGYVNEGRYLTVMGVLSKKSGVPIIIPPSEPFSTGCMVKNFLFPVDVDGLLLKISDRNYFSAIVGAS